MIEGEACRTLLMFSIRALKALLFQDCYHVYSLYCNNISHLHLERAIFVDILLHIYSCNPETLAKTKQDDVTMHLHLNVRLMH